MVNSTSPVFTDKPIMKSPAGLSGYLKGVCGIFPEQLCKETVLRVWLL